ncbi:hypothetical protein KQX54_005946 [Cotesia glomerata]|uniref:Uncharacterized protein n=1 Tax=Cotesia glomerata TaxID=32391 RepID=A0AAV7IA33_COTGL|nr:hypothetical protein KQX54_005946 [Cotesia glomerata]
MNTLLVLLAVTIAILTDKSTVTPPSSDERVTVECMARNVKMKFTPSKHFQAKLGVEMNFNKIGCFEYGDPGKEVALVVNFKHCTNKNHTFELRILEKYKGLEHDPDFKKKRATRVSYATITCPPFPKIPADTRFGKCPGYITRVNGWAKCFESE